MFVKRKINNIIGLVYKLVLIVVVYLNLSTSLVVASGSDDFIIKVKTDNSGSSSDTQFTISTSSYDYNVDCDNDGTFEVNGQHGDYTCNYSEPGIYTIRIERNDDGEGFELINFGGGADGNKLLSIEQWGTGEWLNFEGSFKNCGNLVINASDVPDLSNVTSVASMFENATSLVNGLSNWNTSSLLDMSRMFYGASAFNEDLSSWNVSNVESMSNMFYGVTLSTTNYDALLIGWNNLSLQSDVDFSAGNSKYCSGETARNNIISNHDWTISDGGLDCSASSAESDYFVIKVKTDNEGSSGDTQFTVPTLGIGYNYNVDCNGDGTDEATGIADSYTCNYGSSGEYTIKIKDNSGSSVGFPRIYFNGGGDSAKLLSIEQWGTMKWDGFENAFNGCSNLVINASDVPDLSNVTNMSGMFYGATVFNQDISGWNVSNVTNMSNMFHTASAFNQNIGSWNVSNVTNMSGMFYGATVFNQDISGWNVGNVTNMSFMFEGASAFNQNIGGWNVSNVTNMSDMFYGATVFNQDISGWNVSDVENMSNMFRDASAFNQNIGSWNVGNVTNMYGFMNHATVFNQDISGWNVSNVTTMEGMFYYASAFNQNIGSWNVSNVTNMAGFMSHATAFNQDISGWNVGNVTNMSWMFNYASNFNQDIGDWNVSNVTNMYRMFNYASAFNQNIGSWNVSNVTNMSDMFVGVTLSQSNYDSLLNGWEGLSLQNGVQFNGGNSKYCSGEEARTNIISHYAWTIIDGGKYCNHAPEITSNGGGDTADINVTENQTEVTTIIASDFESDSLSYSIIDGLDSALFTLDSNTHQLSFIHAMDFESPEDIDGDGIYKVRVAVTDAYGQDSQLLTITIVNVIEDGEEIGVASGVVNDNSNSGNNVNLNVCTNQISVSITSLFEIRVTSNSATVYFTPIANVGDYYLSYSTRDTAEDYGVSFHVNHNGVQHWTVNELNSNQLYYFKIRGQNGCAIGEWSKVVAVKTRGVDMQSVEVNNIDVENDSVEFKKVGVDIKVRDEYGNPLSGVKVMIPSNSQIEAVTNQDGIVHFDNLEPGSHRFLIKYKDFTNNQELVLGTNSKSQVVMVQLKIDKDDKSFNLILTWLLIIVCVVIGIKLYVQRLDSG